MALGILLILHRRCQNQAPTTTDERKISYERQDIKNGFTNVNSSLETTGDAGNARLLSSNLATP